MFYKSDLGIHKILFSIKEGLKQKYDYVLVVSGDTGSGKSMFALQLMETWQKIIGKSVNEELIKQICVDKKDWLQNFKELKTYDINVFDEGAKGLSSKQWNEKFSKLLEQLFQVIRYKRFFTVIIVPNLFRLDKFFREDRLRGLFYINKRGHYKYYTRKRVIELTGKNDRLQVKNMNVVNPIVRGIYPDYKGVLLKAYDEMKEEGVNNILEETLKEVEVDKTISVNDMIEPDIIKLNSQGLSYQEIANQVSEKYNREINKMRISRILNKPIKVENSP